jgi:phosphoribosylanthranilate isomerase
VIRAVRVDESTIPALAATVQDHKHIPLRAVLVDARVAGQFGGSGRTAPWKLIADAWRPDWPPLILAGGLIPENVADAIAVTHPWGVDTASGVESSPGLKDVALARRFINAARGT